MMVIGPLEMTILGGLVVLLFGWRALPRLFRMLDRGRLLSGASRAQLRRLLRWLSP